MHKIVLIDFAGTLILPEVLDEANKLRSSILQRGLPTTAEHSHPEALYKANREAIGALTGIQDGFSLQYRENDLQRLTLTGEQVQNQMATNLFQLGMYLAAKKYGLKMFPEGFLDQLQRMKRLGYKLAIVSGVREDIITGMFVIAQMPVQFDWIYGQPPILGVSNEDNMRDLQQYGSLAFVLGDKMSDLEAGKTSQAKTIFVTWGHPSGEEEAFADYTIHDPKELESIIN